MSGAAAGTFVCALDTIDEHDQWQLAAPPLKKKYNIGAELNANGDVRVGRWGGWMQYGGFILWM